MSHDTVTVDDTCKQGGEHPTSDDTPTKKLHMTPLFKPQWLDGHIATIILQCLWPFRDTPPFLCVVPKLLHEGGIPGIVLRMTDLETRFRTSMDVGHVTLKEYKRYGYLYVFSNDIEGSAVLAECEATASYEEYLHEEVERDYGG
jgi:hypothetical protein